MGTIRNSGRPGVASGISSPVHPGVRRPPDAGGLLAFAILSMNSSSALIALESVSKRYGSTTIIHDLSFTVERGEIVGFLGPNGAGKTTTTRLILGLDHPTAGTATIDGRAYRELKDPLRTVGALLDVRQAHP